MEQVTHVILGFEGFNHPLEKGVGRPIPMDTPDNRVVDILNTVKKRFIPTLGARVAVQAYATDMDEFVQHHAKRFLNQNLSFDKAGNQTGKLLIYGYSMGGDTAVELATFLNRPNAIMKNKKTPKSVEIELVVTVDAATFNNFGIDRDIPPNVKVNENFWTSTPKTKFGQKGGENRAIDASKTTVNNHKIADSTHATIYKMTKARAIELLVKALNA